MRPTPLSVERLEDRTVPATYGIPWLDPTHLTLSFAADGTPIVGHDSELLFFLDQRFSRAAWQREFVRAFQTWAQYGNLSIGLRPERITPPDYPFGVAGRTQGDPRFGDIRVGGQAMSPDVLSIAAPPDPFVAGTLGGDVFLNITADINATNLFPILLHEAGHTLGLEHSDDPASVMYSHLNTRAGLSAGDVNTLRGLYGVRGQDRNERCNGGGVCEGNDVPNRSTRISYSDIAGYQGATPLVVYGDVRATSDTDYFMLQSIDDYTGPVTFRLQTRGISPALSRMTIQRGTSDGGGTVIETLGRVDITDPLGDVVTFTIPQVTWRQGTRYFARVESAAPGLYAAGRYALAVTFDQRVQAEYLARLDEVMRGRYDVLTSDSDRDIDLIFRTPNEVQFNLDGHTNDTPDVATLLAPLQGYPENSRYEVLAGIEDANDVDYYRITSPQAGAGQSVVLTATLIQPDLNGVLPFALVFDVTGQPLADGVDVLLDGNGTFTLQVAGLAPETDYLVAVRPRVAADVGNYALTLDFGTRAAALETFTVPGDRVSVKRPEAEYALYVGRSQLFQLVLDAGERARSQAGRVRLRVFDARGTEVYTLTADAGTAASGAGLFLVPGAYRVRFTAEGDGPRPPVMRYRLRGLSLTDPVGPVLGDSLLLPQYECENDPTQFCYPGGIVSPVPFAWVLLS